MRDFEERGYANSADETAKVITAYHDIVKKKTKNTYSKKKNYFSALLQGLFCCFLTHYRCAKANGHFFCKKCQLFRIILLQVVFSSCIMRLTEIKFD